MQVIKSKQQKLKNYKIKLHKIKAFIFDVDGVFTDGMVLPSGGDFLRMHNAKDGYAVRYALTQGYPIGIITGGASETIRERFNMLGVTDVYLASFNKIGSFTDFCRKYNLQPDEVLCMGDDIPDIEILTSSGLPTCPADAVPEVKAVCEYISDKPGGKACVRDVIEQTLKLQGKWNLLCSANQASN
ncbi:MAG: HAD hydrolase family protein [Prevotellaceae bacterium]|jgi:3-deoxy-D-manno-octulosonate 8-phosphate phosphatase (KDO 8-P phosphatase)|nr:HAD hydrolase family protein [Prevotellaceae bacterium]